LLQSPSKKLLAQHIKLYPHHQQISTAIPLIYDISAGVTLGTNGVDGVEGVAGVSGVTGVSGALGAGAAGVVDSFGEAAVGTIGVEVGAAAGAPLTSDKSNIIKNM
jgi:hypothetical protein